MRDKFAQKVAAYFSELGYNPTDAVNYDNFYSCVMSTILHCPDPTNAGTAISYFNFCDKHWSKIAKLYTERIRKEIHNDYSVRTEIDQTDDEETFARYFITNSLTKDKKHVNVIRRNPAYMDTEADLEEANGITYQEEIASLSAQTADTSQTESDDNENIADCFMFSKIYGGFAVFTDGDLYAKPTVSGSKVKICDIDKEPVCTVVFNPKTMNISFKNNRMPYRIGEYGDYIVIYPALYYDSVKNKKHLDTDKAAASILWDIMPDDEKHGVAMLDIYENVNSLIFQFMVLVAFSTFYLYSNYRESSAHTHNSAASIMLMNMSFRQIFKH